MIYAEAVENMASQATGPPPVDLYLKDTLFCFCASLSSAGTKMGKLTNDGLILTLDSDDEVRRPSFQTVMLIVN
jgi:hypothetical protein